MNLEQSAAIRIAINDTLNQLRPPVMGAGLSEPTCAALHTHLVALLKEELRALTGQALEGDLAGKSDVAPWYPDDSGEWVEWPGGEWPGGECPVAAYARVLVRLRDDSETKTPISACYLPWNHQDRINDIVAYKVVKPCA